MISWIKLNNPVKLNVTYRSQNPSEVPLPRPKFSAGSIFILIQNKRYSHTVLYFKMSAFGIGDKERIYFKLNCSVHSKNLGAGIAQWV
jgi:hypothetical protein